MLEHGGKLRVAAEQYQIPLSDWLDVSTGINPNTWPIPSLDDKLWNRLPEDNDGLMDAASSYYDCDVLLPVAGSQAAIQTLPLLREKSRVGVLHPSYNEHAHAWRRQGHEITCLQETAIDDHIEQLDVMLLVNPNNPTARMFTQAKLLSWLERLQSNNGWLIVDEAFIDVEPHNSLSPLCPQKGLIVLRSLGKFFGLAGARVGFVFAEKELLQLLQKELGPWTITGPSREIAKQALLDKPWQEQNRKSLLQQGKRLADLLRESHLPPCGGTALFQWTQTEHAQTIYEDLGHKGILCRLFKEPDSLRFGLPATEDQWQRLTDVLSSLKVKPS